MKNKRRLTALWLFLVAIELFCPALCGKPAFAVEASFPAANISRDDQKTSKCEQISVSDCQSQNRDEQLQIVCTDECLCRTEAIGTMPISAQKPASFGDGKIAFLSSSPIFNSLPPPHRPPKNF